MIAPPPSGQVAQVELWNTDEFGETWYVTMTTGTSGATIFYKIGQNGFIDPTHNGGQATNGTSVYAGGPIPVPVGSTCHFRAVAYKAGLIDSVMADLTVDNVENGGNAPAAGQRTVTYQNDPLNRTSMIDNGTEIVYGPPSGVNQYTSVTGHTLAYDSNFNLSGYDGWTYVYDAEKRLISASGSGTAMGQGHSAQLVYDGLGRCVKRTIDNVTTLITYDGWKPVAEWNGTGGLVAWNLYGPGADEILVRYDVNAASYRYYHLDAQGHVQFLLDGNGEVIEKYTYDAFGHPKIMDRTGAERTTTSYGNRFLFIGREYLSDFGIYDYRNRVYHPELGRFMQVDPIGFKGGDVNLFRYCGSNPVNNVDPTGEYYRRHHNGGNSYTVEIPIHYKGGTPEQHAVFASGVAAMDGTYGPHHVHFRITTPTFGERITFRNNEVTVRQGYGADGFGVERGDNSATWYAGGGRGPDGRPVTPGFGAAHSVWHFMGFIDGYDLKTGALKPGYTESHIMGGRAGSAPTDQMVDLVIRAGGGYFGVPGSLGLNFAGGRTWFGQGSSGAMFNQGNGWQPIGSAPADIRWAQNSGTGNWQADQFTKYNMASWSANAGEGSHPRGPR